MNVCETLIHIKTGTEYNIKGAIKCKIDGSWVEMILYENKNYEQFCRFDHDFDGFKKVEK
jgi:hypothetical protein